MPTQCVPALDGQVALPDRHLLAYEDVFATGRCELLMGDVIALADRDPALLPRLDRLVDGVCADLRAAAEETGRRVPLADCVPTQGDPTEPNIADPLCWLDFEFAGHNTAVGEAVNLLWYSMTLGGWFVPDCQPDVYGRTLHLALPPQTRPRIDVRYSWNTGPGRGAAITQALNGLRGEGGTAMEEIHDFLALRILGVIPAARLNGHASCSC
ncbi:hypothetical protein [Streptomyces goshikiensis]|uniref:hypothetical protein n=1 Tax=Streptomyces goshikiensis TaxID=1942 RepID=UPI0036DBB567